MSEPSRLDKSLENLKMTVDKRLLNPEFWQSTSSIEDYCKAILANFDKSEMNVAVTFGNGAYRTGNYGDKNVITLPKAPAIITDQNRKVFENSIIFRSVVLRHELAHVIFTDSQKKTVFDDNELNTVFAFVEDSRVENLFSKTMKGSRYNFIRIAQPFYDMDKENIETVMSLVNLFYYFSYRCSEYNFVENEITSIYESFYNKYKYIIDETDCESAYSTYKIMYAEARDIVSSFNKNKKKEATQEKSEEKQEVITEEEKQEDINTIGQEEERESEEDNGEEKSASEEDESDGKGNGAEEAIDNEEVDEEAETENDDEGKKAAGTINNDEVDEEAIDNEEVDEEAIDNEEVDEEAETENDDSEEEKSNDSSCDEDAEDSDVNESDSRDDEGNECHNEPSHNDTSEEEDLNDAEDVNEEAKLSIMDALKHDYITASEITDLIEFENFEFNFDSLDLKVSELYASSLYKKTKSWHKIFGSNSGTFEYRRLVNEYSKSIGDLTRLFKLKIQSRTRTRESSFHEEGEIDQSNLQEFVINAESPRGFVRKIKSITPSTNIIILLDISGSMEGSRVSTGFINCVIIMEACKRLGLNCQISLFSTRLPSISLKDNAGLKEKNIGKNINLSPSGKIERQYKAVITTIKRLEEKHAPYHETILGNFCQHSRKIGAWCGSTPEFQVVNNMFMDLKNKYKNTIFFVINDGGYDKVDAFNIAAANVLVRGIHRGFAISSYNEAIDDIEKRIKELDSVVSDESLLYKFNHRENFNLSLEQVVQFKKDVLNHMLAVTNHLRSKESQALKGVQTKEEIYRSSNAYLTTSVFPNYIGTGEKSVLCVNIQWAAEYISSFDYNENQRDKYIEAKAKSTIVEMFNRVNDEATHVSHFIYRKYVAKIRENGWKVIGIGIGSDIGKHYIGTDSFTTINSMTDLNRVFVKKLEAIF